MDDLEVYKKYQPEMGTGDLIEWSGKTILARMIRWVTKKRVNHSSLLLRIDYTELSDRRFILEALGKGLEFNLLSKSLTDYSGEVYWNQLKPEFDDRRNKMASWAILRKSERIKYDYSSLFAQLFGSVSVDGRRYFCSEYYHAALIFAGIVPPSKTALRPGEFGDLNIHKEPVKIF